MNKQALFLDKLLALLRRAEIDRAVFFSLLGKIWGFIAVPVNYLLIAKYFSPELQGYYYTFASILAFQFLIELGLGRVIMQFASHEWSGLYIDERGEIKGEPENLSRLQSLAKFAFKWYGFASLLVTIGLMAGGYIFFAISSAEGIKWMLPWFALSILNGVVFCLIPVWSLIEGCNQVGRLYAYRFVQSIFSSLAIWVAIFFGAALWTLAIATLMTLVCAVIFLISRYWIFFKTLLFASLPGHRIDWNKEIWPLQWRVIVTYLFGPFATILFVPVLFYYHGAVIAGQAGMTLNLIGALSAVASSWIYPKMPLFGILISNREYDRLDRLFWKITKIVSGITISGAFFIYTTIFILGRIGHPLSVRFLPLLPFFLFLLPQVLNILSLPMACYLRAHKKEPLAFLSAIEGVLIGMLTLIVGKNYGAMGIGISYLLISMVTIPLVALIWYRAKNEWHRDGLINAT